MDAKTEMAIADALDDVRTRNAQRERADLDLLNGGIEVEMADEEAEKAEREIEEAARKAFQSGTGEKVKRLEEEEDDTDTAVKIAVTKNNMPPPPAPPTFQRQIKKKKDFGAALGIKKKTSLV